MASRANGLPLRAALVPPCMRNVLTWQCVLCDRAVFDEVEKLVNDVASFATNLVNSLTEFIDSLPSPAKLMQMAGDFIKEKLLGDDGLCLAPSCGDTHINSGMEKDLVPNVKNLEILASQPTTHADRPHATRYNRVHAFDFVQMFLTHHCPHNPPLSRPLTSLDHS